MVDPLIEYWNMTISQALRSTGHEHAADCVEVSLQILTVKWALYVQQTLISSANGSAREDVTGNGKLLRKRSKDTSLF